jgi:hypothetical protein
MNRILAIRGLVSHTEDFGICPKVSVKSLKDSKLSLTQNT